MHAISRTDRRKARETTQHDERDEQHADIYTYTYVCMDGWMDIDMDIDIDIDMDTDIDI